MKPVTKLHHQVVALHNKLPELTRHQIQHAFKSCFDPMGYIMRKTIFCFECGNDWKDNDIIAKKEKYNILYEQKSYKEQREMKFHCKCPSCNKKLELIRYYDNGAKDSAYYEVITTIGNFQVYRIFEAVKYMKKKQISRPFITEIVQTWIGTNGSKTIMAVPGGTSYYGTSWHYGKLEIKHDNNKYSMRAYKTYPKKRFLPEIEKYFTDGNYGFKENGDTYGFNEKDFVVALLSSPTFETILKTKNKNLIEIYIKYTKNFNKFWPSIKIALRNDYKPFIKKPNTYFDYLNLLNTFGKDLRSPKYICPINLDQEHDRYVKKMRVIQKKKDFLKTMAEIEKDQILYNSLKSKFFGLEFRSETDNIVIKTITEVSQLMKESDILAHCAFTNKYHKKKDSLLMSAYLDGVVIKTIEIDLGNLRINQCRGYKNDVAGDSSGKQKQVMKLLKENLYQVKEILYPKKKKKSKEKVNLNFSQNLNIQTINQYQQAI